MEEAKTLSQQQQQQLLLFQQLQQQQQKQQAAISRFPSNIDSHLGLHRSNLPPQQQQQQQNQMNQCPNLSAQKQQKQQQSQNPNTANLQQQQQSQNPNSANLQQQQQSQNPNAANLQQQQQKAIRPGNQIELQMAYQDAWRVYSVCEDVFSEKPEESMNRCVGPPYLRERIFYRTLKLLPYHVVADYEAEEDDRILDSDTTGQMLSRSQQWDHNIAAKVAEFTATFEKQVYAFNLISRKRRIGDFRAEERLMIEQVLLQEEKRGLLEVKTEIESREKAGREAHEAKLRAMVQAERARAESQSHAEMMAQAPLRSSALGSQGSDIHDMSELDRGVNPDEMVNGWGNRGQRDEKEPSDDFLNDEETENGDTAQDDWHDVGEFDLNTQ